MAHFNARQVTEDSIGPFVTASGRRMPIRVLSESDVAGLIEFSDYLGRRTPDPEIVGLSRADIEHLVRIESGSMLGIMAGPRGLVRGVASYVRTSSDAADVRFTVDDSLLSDEVLPEMVRRISQSAQHHDITELRADALLSPAERTALTTAGYPTHEADDSDQRLVLDVSRPTPAKIAETRT